MNEWNGQLSVCARTLRVHNLARAMQCKAMQLSRLGTEYGRRAAHCANGYKVPRCEYAGLFAETRFVSVDEFALVAGPNLESKLTTALRTYNTTGSLPEVHGYMLAMLNTFCRNRHATY